MTPQREAKHVQRAIRRFTVEQLAAEIVPGEQYGFYCILGRELVWYDPQVGACEVGWDDAIEMAKIAKFVASRPERQFATPEQAAAFAGSWSPVVRHAKPDTAPDQGA